MNSANLTQYQGLLHRMLYRKLQWLDYYGDTDHRPASEACHRFADLIVHTTATRPDRFLVSLHDATLAACQAETSGNHTPAQEAYNEMLGTLFNNARDIYIALFHSDPIRVLPSDHIRFPWENFTNQPQDPYAIDIDALTMPLDSPQPRRNPASIQGQPWLVPLTISAFFSLAMVFILVGLNQ